MGYDVHISRSANWLDSTASPISLEEWLAYVARDPEMELEDEAIARIETEPVLGYSNPGLAVWTAYSGHDPDGNKAWFDFCDGRVVVKNPDEEILTKMKAVSMEFRAFVVGDDGEHY